MSDTRTVVADVAALPVASIPDRLAARADAMYAASYWLYQDADAMPGAEDLADDLHARACAIYDEFCA